MPAVELPDLPVIAIDFIRTKTMWTDVSTKVKNPRPAKYVQVVDGGGPANRVFVEALLTVTVGAASADGENGDTIARREARRLHHAFLNDSSEMRLVRGVESVSSPYFDPDPDDGSDRYSFTIRWRVRGARV